MLALAFAATTSVAGVTMNYDQFSGLVIDVSGARLIAGSAFQYFEPGWKGGVYSSRWQPKSVTRTPGQVTVRFDSRDANVVGTIRYTLTGDQVKADYDFGWQGNREVRIENCFGLLWASAFRDATAVSPQLRRSRFSDVPFTDQSLEQRALAIGTNSLSFDAPFGELSVRSSEPFTVYDARNLNQEWAKGRPVHWVGATGHAIKPGERVAYSVTWTLSKLLDRPPATESLSGVTAKIERAVEPPPDLPIVPKPRQLNIGLSRVRTSGRFVLSEDHPTQVVGLLNAMVAERWEVEDGPPTRIQVRTVSQRGYSMQTEGDEIHVSAGSEEMLRCAVGRLSQLVRSDDAGLYIPEFTITNDYPQTAWRGVHMFVGPQALQFQSSLTKRLLLPLGFNNVVLQCERTAWEAAPGTGTAISTSKGDLQALFAMYRAHAIEPTPLIQSLGHMEWLFANGQNLELAVNRASPYTLDSRKPEARELIGAVWTEAVSLLRPKSMHFGFDEIDARGMNDPQLATRLWKIQLPFLTSLAKANGATPMIWADMALSAEEANGVAHAPDKETAAERRSLIPKDAVVVDWQYAVQRDPEKYTSLDVWIRLGVKSIAAGANSPDNIFGLATAARKVGGYLQTTWAGYESSPLAMAKDLSHLASYALAAEYAWGHQSLPPDRLGYDPRELARSLVFDASRPTRPSDGLSLLVNAGPEHRIGQYKFRGQSLVTLRSNVSSFSATKPTGVIVAVNRPAKRIALSVDTFAWMDYGVEVAVVRLRLADGSTVERRLVYGFDLRAQDDPNPTATPRSKSNSCVTIEVGETPAIVRSIEFLRSDAAAGLRVHGITLL